MVNTDVLSLIPPPELRGIWALKGPFANLLLLNVAYTAVSIRGVAELINAGVDPYSAYYEPKGISQEQFAYDVSVGMAIVSLQAGQGVWIDVPSTYIAAMPDLNGVPYTPLVAAIRLGAVEDEADLTVLKQRLVDVVKEELGVVGTVEIVQVGLKTLITQDEHRTASASRASQKAESDTDYSKYLAEKTRADSLALRVQALEAVILAKQP